MQGKKHPHSPSQKDGEKDNHQSQIKKIHIWRDFEPEPPDIEPDIPFEIEPNFDPPWL